MASNAGRLRPGTGRKTRWKNQGPARQRRVDIGLSPIGSEIAWPNPVSPTLHSNKRSGPSFAPIALSGTTRKSQKAKGLQRNGYFTGGGDSDARVGREWADNPPCSQRPHDKTVVPRCAQLRTICPPPTIRFRRCGVEGTRNKRREAWRFPVLAQRAAYEGPRRTRARWETARQPFPTMEEWKEIIHAFCELFVKSPICTVDFISRSA